MLSRFEDEVGQKLRIGRQRIYTKGCRRGCFHAARFRFFRFDGYSTPLFCYAFEALHFLAVKTLLISRRILTLFLILAIPKMQGVSRRGRNPAYPRSPSPRLQQLPIRHPR